MSLHIGSTEGHRFELPVDVLTHTVAILAKKGAGKTYTAGVLEEEFAERGLPFIVLDPVGVHYGIRSKASGKRSGYPVVVFGGRHADVDIERDMGQEVAEAVVEENISCIIDLSELSKTAWRQFTKDFCRTLYRKNQNTTPRHIFIEEATEFVPQTRRPEMQEVYESVERLVRMGRNRGLGVTLISQRSAQISKDVLYALDILIALRTVGTLDRKAMIDMFGDVLEEDDLPKLEEFKRTIPRISDGTAWVWSPEYLKCFSQVQIRERTTFHAGATVQMEDVQLVQARPDVTRLRERLTRPEPEPKPKQKSSTSGKDDARVAALEQTISERDATVAEQQGALEKATTHLDRLAAELTQYREDAATLKQLREIFTPPAMYQLQSDDDGKERIEQIAPAVDEEGLIKKILARVSQNGVVVHVVAPEALRKKYLELAVERLYARVQSLGEDDRTALEILLTKDVFWSASKVCQAIQGNTAGQAIKKWRNVLTDLKGTGLIHKGGVGAGEYKAVIQDGVRQELAAHSPTDQEIEQVVQHVLAKVATA